MVKDVSNLVYYLYRTPCSLAGTHRGRQDSSCLGPDLTLLEATGPKGAAQEGRGADRPFGAYHLLYLREGERLRRIRRSRLIHPALTALTACGAVCTALHGLGQPKAPQPHGAHTPKLVVSSRSCHARVVAATPGPDPCRGRVVPFSREREARFWSYELCRPSVASRQGQLRAVFRVGAVEHLHAWSCLMVHTCCLSVD